MHPVFNPYWLLTTPSGCKKHLYSLRYSDCFLHVAILYTGSPIVFLVSVISAICDVTGEALSVFSWHDVSLLFNHVTSVAQVIVGWVWGHMSPPNTPQTPPTHPLHRSPAPNANACGFHFWWLFILLLIWADLQHTFYLLTAAPLLSVMKASRALINSPDHHIKCIVCGE